jgi:hypothetical protein
VAPPARPDLDALLRPGTPPAGTRIAFGEALDDDSLACDFEDRWSEVRGCSTAVHSPQARVSDP